MRGIMRVDNYYEILKTQLDRAMEIAKEARSKGYDYWPEVEIKLAPDVAGRVEGIVGPPGIADEIRKMVDSGMDRVAVAFEIAKKIATDEFPTGLDLEAKVDQAVRTGLAVITEGVLVAPTEGISSLKIEQNSDGTKYLAIYFAGPIRSAGGTAAAVSVLLADHVRRLVGIGDFEATETELARYVEEINIYDAHSRLQYKPSDDDIKWIFKNCKVCINGEPTIDAEVSIYRDLPRMGTNRVRGGVALVSCEGIALKARKLVKYSKRFGLGWEEWLSKLVKEKKKSDKVEIKPIDSFLDGLVAGRPVFSHPSAKGGFRLRYGRTPYTGIASKAIHPATMILLEEFPALGTQFKIERPGKGMIVTPCDSIMPPIVKLKNGDVVYVTSSAMARELKNDVEEILFLGDMLVSFGDFAKANHVLLPSPFVEEWWDRIAETKGLVRPRNAREAFEMAKNHSVPLYPKYLYFWSDLTKDDIRALYEWLRRGKFEGEQFIVDNGPKKRLLELAGVPHLLRDEHVVLEGDVGYSVYKTLGLDSNRLVDEFDKHEDVCSLLSVVSGVEIKKKSTYYIGARMGRPEKAASRAMDGKVNGLFPIGNFARNRSVINLLKSGYAGSLNVDIVELRCPKCRNTTFRPICENCGTRIPINPKNLTHSERKIDFKKLYEEVVRKCQFTPDEFKSIKGLTNKSKVPEPLEKGLLRAKHGVTVFKDGTARFDSTDMPATHFRPREIGVSVDKLRQLGYTHDKDGNPLVSEEQVVSLYPQDIILSEHAVDFLIRVANFIDDLLIFFYGMKPYYRVKSREDLIGQLVITLAPHTSAGVLGRVIGFIKGRVGISHPYVVCARRRNADGDEDAVMLLMDAFMNFSKLYLPETRGGTMDTSLVLTTIVDPAEVDDEVHEMEVVSKYPLEFYEATYRFESPDAEKLGIDTVAQRLGKDNIFDIDYTHDVSDVNDAPEYTMYVKLGNMAEKLKFQFGLNEKIRAVDIKDAAQRLLSSHFIPDIYGNLRKFSRQSFRCGQCNTIYRRVPLIGKCEKCGGKLLLTINKGGIEKYLKLAKDLVVKYQLPEYNLQRLKLVEVEIKSIFENERKQQADLFQFM